jgi:O-antigen ligase
MATFLSSKKQLITNPINQSQRIDKRDLLQIIVSTLILAVSYFQYLSPLVDLGFYIIFFLVPISVVLELTKPQNKFLILSFTALYFLIFIHSHYIGSTPGRSMLYAHILLFCITFTTSIIRSEAIRNYYLYFFYTIFLLAAIATTTYFFIEPRRHDVWFLDANYNGLISLLGLFITAYFLAKTTSQKRLSALYILTALFTAPIVITESRVVTSIYIIAIILILIYSVRVKSNLKTFTITTVITFLLLHTVFSDQINTARATTNLSTLNHRTTQWLSGAQYLSEHGYSGGGLGSWRVIYPRYRSTFSDYGDLIHNDYLQYLIELGPLGLLLLTAPFLYISFRFFKLFLEKQNNTPEFLLLLILGCIHGYCLPNYFFHRFETFSIYLLLFVLAHSYHSKNTEKQNLRLSSALISATAIFTFALAVYSSSAVYYHIRLSSCLDYNNKITELICNETSDKLYEIISPSDLPKSSLDFIALSHLNQTKNINNQSKNEYLYYSTRISSFLDEAKAKGQATSEHYATHSFSLLSLMLNGIIQPDFSLVEENVNQALKLDPSNPVAILTMAIILQETQGKDPAFRYLTDFLNSDWMKLGRVRQRSGDIIKLWESLKVELSNQDIFTDSKSTIVR